MLAYLPPEKLDEILEQIVFKKFTERTVLARKSYAKFSAWCSATAIPS